MTVIRKYLMCFFYDIQVSGLQAGQTYRLRVSAVNEAGVGCASLPTEPVTAQTLPGQPSCLQRYEYCNKKITSEACWRCWRGPIAKIQYIMTGNNSHTAACEMVI